MHCKLYIFECVYFYFLDIIDIGQTLGGLIAFRKLKIS